MGKGQPECFAESLRITIFPSGKLPGDDAIWHRLTGHDPEVDENRRAEAMRRQVGPHSEGELEVRVLPGRVDLLMRVLPSIAIENAYIGPFAREANAFIALARPWLSDLGGDVMRVAFGGVVLYPAADRADAYELLAKYVPSLQIVDAEQVKEAWYRVNRPKESQYGTLNRITTWQPAVRSVSITTSGAKTVRMSGGRYLRLEFDHNTLAERSEPLEQTVILPIYEEPLSLALENASRGECP
jgi:hypothetical protein